MPKYTPKKLPDKNKLLAYFNYDKHSGQLQYKKNCKYNRHKKGDTAGYVTSKGYIAVWAVDGDYLAHRIIWFLVYNEEPPEIDHINGNRSDNRISNLRASNKFQNPRNRVDTKIYPGIRIRKQKEHTKYVARITILGIEKYLGTFNDLEEAIKVRKEYEVKYDCSR